MIAEIAVRLKAQSASLKLVGGAVDFAALQKAPPAIVPAAWVVPLSERPQANVVTVGVAQRVEAGIGIVVAVRHLGDARGGGAVDVLESLRAEIRGALLGWSPAAGIDRLVSTGGDLLGFEDGLAWWMESFATQFTITA